MTETTELTHWSAAKQSLALARSTDEVLHIRDKVRAMELYARQSQDRELERDALDIRTRAERRLGELLIQMKMAGQMNTGTAGLGDANVGRAASTGGAQPEPPVAKEPPPKTLAELGITKKLSTRAQALANLPASEFELGLDREKQRIGREVDRVSTRVAHGDDKAHQREQRERELGAKQHAFPQRLYGVIYADPPWKGWQYSDETGMDRSPENHYPTMTLEEIQRMPVADICAKDVLLAMWARPAMLVEAFCVADAWGFAPLLRDSSSGFLIPAHYLDKVDDDDWEARPTGRYITELIWSKVLLGTGYWARAKHECLLLFKKGNPIAPAMGTQEPSLREDDIYTEKRTGHSRKPDAFADELDRMYPSLPKIELFARLEPGQKHRLGWDVFGNEAGVE